MKTIPRVAAALLAAAAIAPAAPAREPLPAGPVEAARPIDPLAGVAALAPQQLVAAVLERNPSLAAARHALAAARARVPQARSLPDPTAAYALAPLSIASDDVPFGNRLELEQMIPWPGTRRAMAEGADAAADASAERLAALAVELAREAVVLHAELYRVGRQLEVNEAHRLLVEELLVTATGRYAAGSLEQQDPLQAEVELAHLAHDRIGLFAERDALAARLNALLRRPAAAPLPPASPPEVPADLAVLVPQGPGELATLAASRRPELAESAARIAAAHAAVALARLERRPDLGVMASWDTMWMETEHRLMAGVSVSLPVWRDRLAARLAEAEAELAAVRAERVALEDSVAAEVQRAYSLLVESHHVLDLYDSRLLPAARDRVASARTAVETARGSFLGLVEAEKDLREIELQHSEALASFQQRLAELERAVGLVAGTGGLAAASAASSVQQEDPS